MKRGKGGLCPFSRTARPVSGDNGPFLRCPGREYGYSTDVYGGVKRRIVWINVDTGDSLGSLLLCAALLAYAAHWWGCFDGYESDSDEEGDTDATRSMFS